MNPVLLPAPMDEQNQHLSFVAASCDKKHHRPHYHNQLKGGMLLSHQKVGHKVKASDGLKHKSTVI